MEIKFKIISIKNRVDLVEKASQFFSAKWRVNKEAYFKCMTSYINNESELPWYICLNDEEIIGGVGVIENDFHPRKDLTPNIFALYVREDFQKQGTATKLIRSVLTELKEKGFLNVCLIIEHNNLYEKLGFTYLFDIKTDGGDILRMYQFDLLKR